MAFIINTDGNISEVEIPKENSLEFLQKCVGGFIQIVYLKDGDIMYINEEGKLMGLPRNNIATKMYLDANPGAITGDYIVGNTIVLSREECLEEEEEE